MKRTILSIVAAALGCMLLLAGCGGSTRVTAEWKDAAYTAGGPTQVMVLGVAEQPDIRRRFETEMVQRLRDDGVGAAASIKDEAPGSPVL